MGHITHGIQFWPAVLTVDLRGFDVVTKLLPSPSRLPGGLFRNSAAHKTDQQKTELMKSLDLRQWSQSVDEPRPPALSLSRSLH